MMVFELTIYNLRPFDNTSLWLQARLLMLNCISTAAARGRGGGRGDRGGRGSRGRGGVFHRRN